MSENELVIKTEGLTKLYSSFFKKAARPALNQLTISVPRGCVFGFLGPNGAGKTTTIKILMGLIRPTGGTAMVLGKPYDDVESKNRIGFLPDSPAFTPTLSAQEFLDICAHLLKIPSDRRKKRVEEVLEIVRMAPHAKSKIGTFSRGMLQRIGIAQAILNQPDLLILDEPLLGLDPYGRQEFKEIILGQKNDFNASVFFSSHILSDVEEICDSISILNKGKLLCAGPIDELLSGGGKGITVDVRHEKAVHELLPFADQIIRKGNSDWEIIFHEKKTEIVSRIEKMNEEYGESVKIRSGKDNLDTFFFKKIEEDNARSGNGK